jgi:hypothetical protein
MDRKASVGTVAKSKLFAYVRNWTPVDNKLLCCVVLLCCIILYIGKYIGGGGSSSLFDDKTYLLH